MIRLLKETYTENLKSSKIEEVGTYSSFREARLEKEKLEGSETSHLIFYRIDDGTELVQPKRKNRSMDWIPSLKFTNKEFLND